MTGRYGVVVKMDHFLITECLQQLYLSYSNLAMIYVYLLKKICFTFLSIYFSIYPF